jgi:hypothetical protein
MYELAMGWESGYDGEKKTTYKILVEQPLVKCQFGRIKKKRW